MMLPNRRSPWVRTASIENSSAKDTGTRPNSTPKRSISCNKASTVWSVRGTVGTSRNM